MLRDIIAIMNFRPMTVEQKGKYTAIESKYVELVTLIEELVPESKARTIATDKAAESAMWARTALETSP